MPPTSFVTCIIGGKVFALERKTRNLYHDVVAIFQNCRANRMSVLFSKCFPIALVVVFTFASACWGQESEARQTYTTSYRYWYAPKRSDVPVLQYQSSRGHHGNRSQELGIDEVLIWKDGTIVWSIASDKILPQWYQAIIPVEKMEAAIQEIALDFANHPLKHKQRGRISSSRRETGYSPSITVCSSHHYEGFGMDSDMFFFYNANREIFQSGDNKAILKTIKTFGSSFSRELSKKPSEDCISLVQYYHQWNKKNLVFGDAKILKCAALYTADVEHLLLMQKKILDLVPPQKGLEVKELGMRTYSMEELMESEHCVHVEREIREGKSKFFYSLVSDEKEWKALMQKTSDR